MKSVYKPKLGLAGATGETGGGSAGETGAVCLTGVAWVGGGVTPPLGDDFNVGGWS